MAQTTIDISGKKGLGQFQSFSNRYIYDMVPGSVVEGQWNPFIRPGYMSPPNGTVTSVTLDQTQASDFSCNAYDAINDDFYFAENGRQMFRGDTLSDTSLTRVLNLSSGDVIKDIDFYMVNGVRKIFVMYNNAAGDAQIAISSAPYDEASDDLTYLTVTITNAFSNDSNGDLFLIPADNGFAYLCMENQVHKIDGTTTSGGSNGTVTPNALLFPNGYRVVDGVDWHGLIFLGIHKYSNDTRNVNPTFIPSGNLEAGVYIWDRQTLIAGTRDFLPLSGFSQIDKIFVSPSGKLRVLASDSSGMAQLLEYTGSSFEPVHRLGFSAQPTFRDSVASLGQITYWLGKDGVLRSYGAYQPGEAEGLTGIKAFSINTENGGVIMPARGTGATSPALYVAYKNNSNALTNVRMKIFNSTGQVGGDTAAAGNVVFPANLMPVYSKLNFIKIPCIPTSSSGATVIATVKVYLNHQDTAWTQFSVTQLQANTGMVDIPINKVGVWSVQLEVVWEANAIGANDFCFHTAILDYEPILKRK